MKYIIKKLKTTNNKLCEILLPDPNPNNNMILSIKSEINAPIINDNRLNSKLFFT
jgi:hypothetical protein